MKFTELPLKGAYLIETQPHFDERGYFARTFCSESFKQQKLVTEFVQCSTSFNLKKGLIRGLHYQSSPYQETKLVRCTRGAIFDVIVDLRKHSPTYLKWFGEQLTEDNGKMFYIPKAFAHGFQVLENQSEVLYMMDTMHQPASACTIAFDSAEIGVQWPLRNCLSTQ